MTSLIVALYLAAVPTVAITGNVLTPDGSGIRSGSITCRLTTPGTAMDGATAQRVASEVTTTITATTGAVSFNLVPNDAITPTGSRYTCTYRAVVNNGRAVQWAEQWQLASTPNPLSIGAAPVPTYPLGVCMPAAPPTISPASGSIASTDPVTITTNAPGASIYYTTDGSTPTTSSTLYSGPIYLANDATVKAIASGGGYLPGSAASATLTVSDLVAYVPASTAGCYASGYALGSRGETVSIARASTATYLDCSGVVQTCAANQIRVGCVNGEVAGIMVEPQRTQLHPSPSAPAAGTATATATGAHQFWVVGTGSQTISAGTATTTGLPCTASQYLPCSFSVSVTGTLSLSAVTGSLTRAQVEAGPYSTSFIPSGTRNADYVTMTNPFPNAGAKCFSAAATAGEQRPWGPVVGFGTHTPLIAGGTTFGAANYWYANINTIPANAQLALGSYSVTPTAVTAVGASPTIWGTGVRDVAVCDLAGSFTAYVDGRAISLTPGGSGLGAATQPATVQIGAFLGAADTSNVFGGYFKSLRFFTSQTQINPTSKYLLALGDSITYGLRVLNPWPDHIAYLMPPRRVENGGVSSNTVAQMQTRWTSTYAARSYSVVVVLGGVNDIRNGTSAAATWVTLSALLDSIRASGARLIPVTVLPFRGDGTWSAGKEVERQALNVSILAYCSTYSLDCIDAGSTSFFDDGTGALKTIYDSGDHLHPNQAGTNRLAELVRSFVP